MTDTQKQTDFIICHMLYAIAMGQIIIIIIIINPTVLRYDPCQSRLPNSVSRSAAATSVGPDNVQKRSINVHTPVWWFSKAPNILLSTVC